MTLIERTIKTQKAELRKAHNERFVMNGTEYRLIYEGGLAEFFQILCRKERDRNFKYFDGFSAYRLATKEDVITCAKERVVKKLKA